MVERGSSLNTHVTAEKDPLDRRSILAVTRWDGMSWTIAVAGSEETARMLAANMLAEIDQNRLARLVLELVAPEIPECARLIR